MHGIHCRALTRAGEGAIQSSEHSLSFQFLGSGLWTAFSPQANQKSVISRSGKISMCPLRPSLSSGHALPLSSFQFAHISIYFRPCGARVDPCSELSMSNIKRRVLMQSQVLLYLSPFSSAILRGHDTFAVALLAICELWMTRFTVDRLPPWRQSSHQPLSTAPSSPGVATSSIFPSDAAIARFGMNFICCQPSQYG